MSNADWHAEGLHVRIRVEHDDDSIHVGMIGIIQSISVVVDALGSLHSHSHSHPYSQDGVCTVHFPQLNRHIVVPLEHMEPVVPKQNDKVRSFGDARVR
jgi:hypothetical protein